MWTSNYYKYMTAKWVCQRAYLAIMELVFQRFSIKRMNILQNIYMKKIRWVIILLILLAVLVWVIQFLHVPPATIPGGLFI